MSENILSNKYKREILDLKVENAKLKIELKYFKNELQLCNEEKNAKKRK